MSDKNIQPEYQAQDEDEFDSWLRGQEILRENIREVCKKYGDSIKKEVPISQFMYEVPHRLLFCRNAKVRNLHMHFNFQ